MSKITKQLKCLVLMTVLVWSQHEVECGLHTWNNTVYLFQEPITNVSMTWHEARIYCQSLDMHLVGIESIEENDAIKNIITENYDGRHFFLDGTDESGEGRWMWKETGERIQCFDWHATEPNNKKPSLDNYMVIFKDKANGEYNWHDIGENSKFLALCEQPL